MLRGKPEWTTEAIDVAMGSGSNRTVALQTPIPVVVFYTTAIVDAGGRAMFLPDVYGHDRRLLAALEEVGSDSTFCFATPDCGRGYELGSDPESRV